jgi:hypothetical protein
MKDMCLNVIGMVTQEQDYFLCCQFSFLVSKLVSLPFVMLLLADPYSSIFNAWPNSNLSILDFAVELSNTQQLLTSDGQLRRAR